MAKEPLVVKVAGFSRLNSRTKSPMLDDSELTNLENMDYQSSGDIEIRRGTELFKSNLQWGEVPVIDGKGYELNESGAEIAVILSNGKIFFIKIADYSDDPRTIFEPDTLWTEVAGIGGTGNALSITNKNEVFWKVLNNKCFFCDGGNQIKYFGSDHILHTVPDPVGSEVVLTVEAINVPDTVSLDAEYADIDDRRYFVNIAKTAGETTLKVRQLIGDGRLPSSGTLTLIAGEVTDPVTIEYSATEFSDNFICLTVISGRLVAISKQGYLYISETNDGVDFNGPQSERLLYGLEDGLKVTDAFPFARSVLLDITNSELRKSACASLTGNIKPDPNIIEEQNPEDFFKIQRESNRISVYGRSGQEINSGFAGLSRDGFIFVSSEDARREFGLNNRESLSSPIQNIVNAINFKNADDIRSTVDEENQRYLCAAPIFDSTFNNVLFVYDFDNSTFAVANKAAVHKWSLYLFNIGGAGITSLFTIFGIPFLGLSDGRVIQTEVKGKYTDVDGVYKSGFITKAFDFGIRTRLKSISVCSIDLVLSEKMRLDIYPIVDEFTRFRDYNGKFTNTKLLTPISLATDDLWTSFGSDVWTQSPIDIWGQVSAERYTYIASKSIPKFQEISFAIQDIEGGKRWGAYGFEIFADIEDEFYDGRINENISVDNAGRVDPGN